MTCQKDRSGIVRKTGLVLSESQPNDTEFSETEDDEEKNNKEKSEKISVFFDFCIFFVHISQCF